MQHTISNELLTVSIQHKGAEISSIKSKVSEKEFMWQANPEIWGSHAPVLFPAIGSFKNDQCLINGKVYQIPKHGFIRHNEDLVVQNHSKEEITFQLAYSETTLSMFPYLFKFSVNFKLTGNTLLVNHKVENLDDKPIHFSLGGHPGFKCPLNEGEDYLDYFIEFEHEENAETTLLSNNGLITDKTRKVLESTNILPLKNDLFDNDALIFKNIKSRKVALKSKKSNQVLTVSFDDFKYLGIWAKPNAPFVCIEPWLGIADHENTDGNYLNKDGLISLTEKDTFHATYSIQIKE